jgi:hypothetical protein
MPRPSHPLFDHIVIMCGGECSSSLSSFLQSPATSSPLGPNIFLSALSLCLSTMHTRECKQYGLLGCNVLYISSACRLLLLGLFLGPEDGGETCFWNVMLSSNYTTLQTRRSPSQSHLENVKCNTGKAEFRIY